MSRRGTTPNPLPLGPFSSHFAQLTSQSQPVQQQPKARPNTLAPRASPLARSPSGLNSANVLSVEEWETKAPLNDTQIRSVAAVKKASEIKRVPDKVRFIHRLRVIFQFDLLVPPSLILLVMKKIPHLVPLLRSPKGSYHPPSHQERQVLAPDLEHRLALAQLAINFIPNILCILPSNSMIGMR